jgi:phosphoglycolate phosphatase-like HAD superfamily hydrolase
LTTGSDARKKPHVKIDTLIFDMDGVITTEEKYWACARLTLWEMVTQTLAIPDAFGDAVHDAVIRESIIPDALIYALKGRAVNSNWDIAYVVICVYLAALPDAMVLSAPKVDDFVQAISDTKSGAADWPQALTEFLATTHGAKGRALIQEAGNRLRKALDFGDGDLLRVEGPFWWYLHERFQRWYHGEAMQQFGAPPLPDGTVLPPEQLEALLKRLREAGYTLGAATGRPRDELNDALDGVGLLNYFDANHIATLDMVRQVEQKLKVTGLVKPHPFTLLRAIYPRADTRVLLDEEFQKIKRNNVVVIGDSTSDVIMAKEAGCRMVGVLTGVRGEEARQERYHLLIHAGCEALLDNVTELPDWLEGQGN